ncbi:regulator of Vps4 activity in the MVB pathway-domain-containing protein [Polychytrium aggregatum]|uniref:regulator of Vps4 activity in the MVB pathway-domain-containing protein n=1 Tax=Polychytrium aggregatum TaxID=110093 RepID=UPI0022FE4673|nr:regulator of Vps4 activity in the MVB pathway-domain-containing protein [Polychytrium aggregatum]KAI9192909.1 regulator of Vps4 activity in the MVB pathway-domain-containing protein [Polychytrium aggregatum]
MSTGSFNANKTKVLLKLSLNRLKLLQQKKAQMAQQARREIAVLLEKGKIESARVRVEYIIREDYNVEAMEILELYCDLVLARFGLVEQMRHCDPGIAEAVNTIIYAAPRMEVKELSQVRDQFMLKYGRDFASAAIENIGDIVNPRVVNKLRVCTPEKLLVNQYLNAIAAAYKVDFVCPEEDLEPIPDLPTGPDAGLVQYASTPMSQPFELYHPPSAATTVAATPGVPRLNFPSPEDALASAPISPYAPGYAPPTVSLLPSQLNFPGPSDVRSVRSAVIPGPDSLPQTGPTFSIHSAPLPGRDAFPGPSVSPDPLDSVQDDLEKRLAALKK